MSKPAQSCPGSAMAEAINRIKAQAFAAGFSQGYDEAHENNRLRLDAFIDSLLAQADHLRDFEKVKLTNGIAALKVCRFTIFGN